LLTERGVKTVALAVPDHIGRLIGKRIPAERYEEIRRDGLSMPDFHLVTGIDNVPQDGFEVTGRHTGFRNALIRPDESTFRIAPWWPATAIVICDALDPEGRPAEVAPRWVLRRQLARLDSLGVEPRCATELEFYLFRGSYERARRLSYRRLTPSYHLHGDNDLAVAGRDEDLIGEIRHSMADAGIPVEMSQGEGGPGQHELSLAHASPLDTADRHVTYKSGVKELAARHDLAATFMAKVRTDSPGSSCHIHLSLSRDGRSALAENGTLTDFGASFLAGILAFTPELMMMHGPYANSYRRLVEGSWAPTNLSWGFDNRTCCVRALGEGVNFRFEFRAPGADVNPYFSLAALLAAGLAGIARELDPPPPCSGDGYAAPVRELPRDLTEAVATFAASEMAAEAFGEAVHEHLTQHGRMELAAVRTAVTDWDLERCFERA
jgi:glutamine synthetase